ncbi:DUF2849 domain-containing protein [Neptunicoccus cionae]|uniref:DUF2849 domain-containing protein n=1 Tax=Neptunicoccus cionae TaxID=2035344 RepID=UPI000C76B1F9|nr:DUF2849 domain-containing protein [Amylibacter cionae]MBR9863005.1 DUF2849 domain-containing protein [Paracoccaceae bacterium]PLS20349.1 DUF2849 domain-containing protein [Amylibacter cionae]
MAKKFTPKVLTANHLLSGDVIYWDEKGDWVGAFEDALYLDTEKLANHVLTLAEKQQDVIVGPYLADAALGPDDKPMPAHFRETFRMTGPSNYHHGKQAEA